MDRLFTCFVSSTFLDLREERQRLVRVLLSNECVPLGMEFFPSAGRSQWPIIQESIEAADFCIFVVGGRYGSISDQPPLSWTRREFREASARGKPIAAMLHADPGSLPFDLSEPTAEARHLLGEFRAELEAHTVCRYYRDQADLVEAVTASIRTIRDQAAVPGWIRRGSDAVPAEEPDFDRVYELLGIDWSFRPSATRPDTVDGDYVGRRRLLCNDVNGLGYCAVDFTRGNQRHLPFDEYSTPRLTLRNDERTGNGATRLDRPRKTEGSTFVQDIVFRPPLSAGEMSDFTLAGQFRSYKFRYREQILEATADARGGARNYEWISRRIAFPTRRLEMRAFLSAELDATPFGPLVGRSAVTVDAALSADLQRSGAYTVAPSERDGQAGIEMSLVVENPSLLRRYRLAWELPTRP
ncbi:DUF4062 domain-containing protein [Solirubrobacter ginsenosidimutans]|uniref:DUF4062 domain-containing protein n=1 Tax=Solirubrobacter ginsenosidimutans TaxID=490573 RepID=A0A9X3S4U9_9ACTN|nr:DUF4062 domain-containing protein [Solirubrobacter ginsenosidimutans]MDA0167070.1 DUF4062 domain-containing protein [Solirubrobacter ginsenosidimutans]